MVVQKEPLNTSTPASNPPLTPFAILTPFTISQSIQLLLPRFSTFGPACTQIRRFDYRTTGRDIQALATFAEMFPNLTILKVIFNGYRPYQWAVWTNECLQPLSLYRDLTNLTLSLNLELAENDRLKNDHDLAWWRRCFLRRFEATKLVAGVCLQLKRCTWVQQYTDSMGNDEIFRFMVEEGENPEKSRVVKSIKEWWMEKEYELKHEGELPGDMVGDLA